MSHSVEMPALGESVTEGTVSSWYKAVGEHVEADEPLEKSRKPSELASKCTTAKPQKTKGTAKSEAAE